MKNDIVKTELNIINNKVSVMRINNINYLLKDEITPLNLHL